MAAGGAQPFQCVNKYVSSTDVSFSRLILRGGQQKTAADAVDVMGTPSWKADCKCGCNKPYDISYSAAYPVGCIPASLPACQLAIHASLPTHWASPPVCVAMPT